MSGATANLPGRPVLRRPSNDVIAGCAMGMVALFVGLINVSRSLNYDEAVTYSSFINGGSPRRALTTQVVFNNHPMFSFIEAILWRFGFVGETAQRLLPVTCGAVTVGLITWYTSRRAAIMSGVVAGTVLLLNPMYFELYRSLRGYSLATLGVVVAGLALQRSWTDPRMRWLVIQGSAMIVAVNTHAYSAVFILTLASATLAMNHLRVRHLVTWSIAAVISITIALPIIDDARANTSARGTRYLPGFGEFTVRELLGRSTPAVAIVGTLVMVGALSIAKRSGRHALAIGAGALVPTAALVYTWQVAQPFDLYSRFFVGLVPFLAVLAGIGARRLPARPVSSVALVAVLIVTLLPNAQILLERESGLRAAGAVINEARALEQRVCGSSVEAFLVYSAPVPSADFARLDDCDVFVSALGLRGAALQAVNDHYAAQLVVDSAVSAWGDAATIALLEAARSSP